MLIIAFTSFFISVLLHSHAVSIKQWCSINPLIIDYSVWKEFSVCLVKEGDSLMRAE